MAESDGSTPDLPIVKPTSEMPDDIFKKHWAARHGNHALDFDRPHGHDTPDAVMRAARSFHSHLHDNFARYHADLNHTHRRT